MRVHFTKMHGLGNDFMVVDLVTQRVHFEPEQIRRLADRHFGIGFDQLLLVEPPRDPELDFRYRIYNADGGEVENCGNGARCFARFVRDQQLTHKREIRVETLGGPLTLRVDDDERVRVDMGTPRFDPVGRVVVDGADHFVGSSDVLRGEVRRAARHIHAIRVLIIPESPTPLTASPSFRRQVALKHRQLRALLRQHEVLVVEVEHSALLAALLT